MTLVLKHTKAAKMTDEEFGQFCSDHDNYRIERSRYGEIIVQEPSFAYTGRYNAELIRQLSNWNHTSKSGYVFDSDSGFTLKNRAILAPDASWILKERWNNLSDKEKKSYSPICPDFVIELKSHTDTVNKLQCKMQEWIDNGCQLGWLIVLEEEKVFIYKPNEEIKIIHGFDNKKLSGGNVLLNFELDLNELKLEE